MWSFSPVVSKPGCIQSPECYALQDNAPLNHITSSVQELYIRGYYGNNINSLDFSGYPQLCLFSVGSSCFKNVKSLKLDGFKKLERIEIGRGSFYSNSSTGELSILNCPSLKEITCGYQSFYNYNVFTIGKMDSLETINIGFQCFYYVKQFGLCSKK